MENDTQPKYFISSRPQFFTSENRILIIGLLLSTLALGVTCFFLFKQSLSSLDDIYDDNVKAITQTMAVVGVNEIESAKPTEEMNHFLDQLIAANPDIATIEFQDNDGNVLYRSQADSRLKGTNPVVQIVPLYDENNIMRDSIGTVHVGVIGKSKSATSQATKMTIIFSFLSAWIISSLVVVSITWILSKHLRTLVQGVKRLSTGDFGYRIPSHQLWGELKHLADSFNDMSARLRVYEDQNIETLTFERNKMEAILLSIADGVLVADNDDDIIIVNDSACEMLGVQSNDVLLGSKITRYTNDEGEQCFEPIIDDFQKHMSEDERTTFIRTVEIDGKTLLVIISPIRDREGVYLGYVMIKRDITKEKEIDRLKTQFISNVSHELRTPVTTIKSYVDTLFNHGNELDEQTYKEFMETINNETDRLKKMVNDILDFSRLESPEYKMEMDHEDIVPIINLTVQSVKMLAEQKDLTISTAIESNLPKVFMNSESVERVLRNLLSNAIKYTTESGRIKVRAEVTGNGNSLEVSIEDSGIGIPDEHLDKIWDRFYRVENEVHTVRGTGLGLHLVKVAIEDYHKGETFVHSEMGKGSVFGFRLPLNLTNTQPEEAQPQPEAQETQANV